MRDCLLTGQLVGWAWPSWGIVIVLGSILMVRLTYLIVRTGKSDLYELLQDARACRVVIQDLLNARGEIDFLPKVAPHLHL